jgi:hypothetical protein
MATHYRDWVSRMVALASLILFTLPVFSQSEKIPNEQRYTMKKGRHHASKLLKNRLLRHVEYLHWYNRFDSSARYIIHNENGSIHEDQHDWSKLSGITFTPWQPRKNTAMAGWRYNNVKDSIELIPYFHVNGQRIFNDNPHLTIGVNEPFEHEIHLNYVTKEITVTLKTARGILSEIHTFTTFRKWLVQIHPYFGGNKRAPRRITLSVRLETTKNGEKTLEK